MYAYIKGQLVAKKTDRIVVETGGIGYNIFYPVGRIQMLPAIGNEVKIYTYTSVREDALQLYGFGSEEELDYDPNVTKPGCDHQCKLCYRTHCRWRNTDYED